MQQKINAISMASPTIHSKLPQVGTTIFTLMSVLAAEYKAINLGQGFPDFMMNQDLIVLVNKSMQDGNNQYVHMNGLLSLREKLAEKMSDLYAASIHPDTEITITPGGTYAIYTALTTVLRQLYPQHHYQWRSTRFNPLNISFVRYQLAIG
jgi:methionine aminotransferase